MIGHYQNFWASAIPSKIYWTAIAASNKPIKRLIILSVIALKMDDLTAARRKIKNAIKETRRILATTTIWWEKLVAWPPNKTTVVIAPGPASIGTARGVMAISSFVAPSACSSGVSLSAVRRA